MATLVGAGLASLKELQSDYSYEDALNMMEILTVKHYNRWAVAQDQRHGR